MIRRLCCLIFSFSLGIAPVSWAAPFGDDEVAARRNALAVAGAFQNDSFKLRDGVWHGKLEQGKTAVIQVNLYAGNQYWFTLGAAGGAKKVGVAIFNEAGAAVECEPYEDGAAAAAGFSPAVSGPYYVRVQIVEGTAASLCLIYCYK